MLQPFEEFKVNYISRLLSLKKRYLVSQAYGRGYDPLAAVHKINILLTDYDDRGKADIHLNAIRHDRYAALLDIEYAPHREKLVEMLSPDSSYKIFWSIVKSAAELKERINRRYKDNMRRYIDAKTNWRISGSTTLHPSVEVTFGELFIILKHGQQRLRIKFEEIEKI